MTTTIPESSTNKDDDDIFDDKTKGYISESYNRSNNCDFNNIDIFTLNKISFKRARIFAKNEEIYYDIFCENEEFEVDSIFSTELESILTLPYDESIALENPNSSNIHLSLCEIDKDTFEKAKSNNQLHSLGTIISQNNDNDNDNLMQPLFGKSLFTKNLLDLYESIFIQLLQMKLNNWNIDDIFNEIKKNISIGYQIPLSNVVILKPGENPNCDANVHQTCAMYFNNVRLDNTNNIDVA
ncbi:23774_t:CDS:2, partial [Cetraspora pellucida]